MYSNKFDAILLTILLYKLLKSRHIEKINKKKIKTTQLYEE